jgi:GNAT superfamily N-acetyltransferase
MIESELKNIKNPEKIPSFNQVKEGDITRFICYIDGQVVGSVSAKFLADNTYIINGLFVDPKNRGKGISSELIKNVNKFLDVNHALGKLINTIKGDAAAVYENNRWVKGHYKSHDAYGGYEYLYDAREKPEGSI